MYTARHGSHTPITQTVPLYSLRPSAPPVLACQQGLCTGRAALSVVLQTGVGPLCFRTAWPLFERKGLMSHQKFGLLAPAVS